MVVRGLGDVGWVAIGSWINIWLVVGWLRLVWVVTYRRIIYSMGEVCARGRVKVGVGHINQMGIHILIGSARIDRIPVKKRWIGRIKRMRRIHHIIIMSVPFRCSFAASTIFWISLHLFLWFLLLLLRWTYGWALPSVCAWLRITHRQISDYFKYYFSKSLAENCRFWYDFFIFFKVSYGKPLSKSSFICRWASYCKAS